MLFRSVILLFPSHDTVWTNQMEAGIWVFKKSFAEIEKKKQEYTNEENKRWRFIFDLFERHNLDETKELLYMEE